MKKTLSAVLFFLIPLISGCAAQNTFLAPPPPPDYSHKVFTKQRSGETVLYLDGEDWYGLINLDGFSDIDLGLDNLDQFLWRGSKNNINIKIFAEKTSDCRDSDSCMRSLHERMPYRRTTTVEKKDISGKKVMIHSSKGRTYVDYCPYYRGYCFNFHISMKEGTDESAIGGLLDSISFVDDTSVKVQLAKIFNVYGKMLQIGVPDTWKHLYRIELLSIPAIMFTPAEGDDFQMYLSGYWGLERSSVSEDEVVNMAKKKMAKWGERSSTKPALREIREKNVTMAYFDATDTHYHPQDPGEYPFIKQGCVMLQGYVFSFTILYTESGRTAAQAGIDALASAKMLDIGNVPTLALP